MARTTPAKPMFTQSLPLHLARPGHETQTARQRSNMPEWVKLKRISFFIFGGISDVGLLSRLSRLWFAGCKADYRANSSRRGCGIKRCDVHARRLVSCIFCLLRPKASLVSRSPRGKKNKAGWRLKLPLKSGKLRL